MTGITPPPERERRMYIPSDVSLHDLWTGVPIRVWRWMLALAALIFSFGAVIGQTGWVGDVVNKISQSSIQQPSAETDKGQKQGATYDTASLVDELRAKHGVKPIDSLQNQMTIDRLPNGSFGYTFYGYLKLYLQYGHLPPVDVQESPSSFEIHRALGGTIYIVGFMDKSDAIALTDPNNTRKQFELFSVAQPNFQAAAVPLNELKQFEVRELPDNKGVIADVTLK